MGIHIYDPKFRKVVTIAVCDMQCEAQDAQVQMWQSLLEVMEDHGYSNINFKDLWLIVPKPTLMLCELYLDMAIQRFL